MTSAPLPILKVAVVGHTNTGKTSLLRTLTRDESFGEVSDGRATTRHVEGTSLQVAGRPVVELYDTPGLEEPIALLELLEELRGDRRRQGAELVEQFLQGPAARQRFPQEAKAIRQVLGAHIALYVIDARQRVAGKYRDELEVLSWCARPIVPVLNFIASPDACTAAWREHLARVGLHAVAEFDTVVVDEHGEQRLYEKMRTLLDEFRPTLDALIEDRRALRQQLIAESASLIADLLIDAAACYVEAPSRGGPEAEQAVERLKRKLRDREQGCVEQLLGLFRFARGDVVGEDLPLAGGEWGIDLFSPEAVRRFGRRAGGYAAAGAGAGLAVDAIFAGLTLGTGTAVGAALGAIFGAGRTGRGWLAGRGQLRCTDDLLHILAARQVELARALFHRGHASQKPLDLRHAEPGEREPRPGSAAPLPEPLREARLEPRWSRLNAEGHSAATAGRTDRHRALAQLIERSLAGRPAAFP